MGDGTQTGPTFWDGGANADVHLHLIVQAVEEQTGTLGQGVISVPDTFIQPSLLPKGFSVTLCKWCFKLCANKL